MNKKIKIVITVLIFLIIFGSIAGFIYFKIKYEKSPAEAWLLNGKNENMYVENVLFVTSVDYNKQFFTGGSLYITNEVILENANNLKVQLCYAYDNECVDNTILNASDGGTVSNNNPITISTRSTTAFEDGFIKKNNKKFDNVEDYLEKLESIYLKLNIVYIDGSTKEYELDINPNPKINKRPALYELPHKEK